MKSLLCAQRIYHHYNSIEIEVSPILGIVAHKDECEGLLSWKIVGRFPAPIQNNGFGYPQYLARIRPLRFLELPSGNA